MTFPKYLGLFHIPELSRPGNCCFKMTLFQVFHDHTNPECDDRGQVRLSKSDKNIGAGGLRVDNLFESADSGDVLAHPRITTV